MTQLSERVAAINRGLEGLLAETRRALVGQSLFGPEQVRSLAAPIAEMAPVMKRAAELRAVEPDIATHLELYVSYLAELRKTLEQIRIMLLAKQAQMEVRRGELQAVGQWAAALRKTQS
jgi:hypothetical protein